VSNLKFDIDVETLSKQLGGLKKDVEKDVTRSAEDLANITHARILELADEELTSLREMYKSHVKTDNSMARIWVITLEEPAMWIEEGRKSGFMEELLNGKSSHVGKNGKYAIIPFQHNKNPTNQSPKAYDLAQEIKYALKKKGVSWKKLETNADGSPRVGLLHKFNVETARPVDAQKDIHKNPLTKGVAVYQNVYDSDGNLVRNADKGRDLLAKGQGTVKKDVMTFRVISEKHKNEGLWVHPGRQGNKIFDKAFDWAIKQWETQILPAIFEKYKK
jgi:hypothetical protein